MLVRDSFTCLANGGARLADILASRFDWLGSSMNKRIVKSYQDITVAEVTQSDGERVVNRAYSVGVATDPRALRQFRDLGSARDYFDGLVLQPAQLHHFCTATSPLGGAYWKRQEADAVATPAIQILIERMPV